MLGVLELVVTRELLLSIDLGSSGQLPSKLPVGRGVSSSRLVRGRKRRHGKLASPLNKQKGLTTPGLRVS